MEFEVITTDNRCLRFVGELKEFEAIVNLDLERLLALPNTDTFRSKGEARVPLTCDSAPISKIIGTPGTTAAMVARLGLNGKMGKNLTLAAIVKLTYFNGQETCTRKEVYTEMKSATRNFNVNMAKTLTHYLNALLREGQVNESSKDVFALTPKALEQFGRKLAS